MQSFDTFVGLFELLTCVGQLLRGHGQVLLHLPVLFAEIGQLQSRRRQRLALQLGFANQLLDALVARGELGHGVLEQAVAQLVTILGHALQRILRLFDLLLGGHQLLGALLRLRLKRLNLLKLTRFLKS
jgi:hypothetical protein